MKVLVSLGGNAILKHGQRGTAEEQEANVQNTAKHLASLLRRGERIAITHGNGPQVGNILLQNEIAKETLPPMPLDVCGAESQGMIGYMFQRALRSELESEGPDVQVATIVSQTLVDAEDPAFRNPTKPVGPFYTAKEAQHLRETKGWHIISDSGRGYRRVVPSPTPLDILEKETIIRLFETGTVVISVGGGGVPVIRDKDGSVRGVEAVLDKDRTAALLGKTLGVDTLLILTDVEKVFINYGKPDQQALDNMTVQDCRKYLAEGQFPSGSMGPKIESAVRFLSSSTGKRVSIAPLERAEEALQGRAGTTITN
ncbi:carbamate kinase [archaeon 13_2_20CM_2_52_21]|nr:MAG: carbamate kinase [archaeon 13_2_20CM_2_52_21]OLD08026.1 MAG: carbamate kinase [Crenarchaeota archaeon 13_1_40CM_3_52_4]OLD44070.1 MAG: carbamate kinase [archaeon 13_1_40CM_2_52_4]